MPLLSIKSSLQNVLGGVADQIYSDQLFDPGADGPRPRDLNFSFWSDRVLSSKAAAVELIGMNCRVQEAHPVADTSPVTKR